VGQDNSITDLTRLLWAHMSGLFIASFLCERPHKLENHINIGFISADLISRSSPASS